jgi:hypothetical protein
MCPDCSTSACSKSTATGGRNNGESAALLCCCTLSLTAAEEGPTQGCLPECRLRGQTIGTW